MNKIIKVNKSYLIYEYDFPYDYINDYYFYIVNLLKSSLKNIDDSIIVNLDCQNVLLPESIRNLKTINIKINYEHTIVINDRFPKSKTKIAGSNNFYSVRIDNYNSLIKNDIIIEYSQQNIKHIKNSGLFKDYLGKLVYIAPILYDLDFEGNRNNDILTSFYNPKIQRRKKI